MSAAAEEALSLEAALEVAGWPRSLLAPEKQPRLVDDPTAFRREILVGCHINELIVYKGGLSALALEGSLPPALSSSAVREPSVRRFLHALDDSTARSWRGRVYCTKGRDESELRNSRGASPQTLDTLFEKRAALASEPDDCDAYIGEIRARDKYRHPHDGRWVKTVVSRGERDGATF